MTRMRLAALSFALLSAAPAAAWELNLAWRPTGELSAPPQEELDKARFQVLPFVDKRKTPEIGENVEEQLPRQITTRDDVAAFVSAHLGDVLQQGHVNVVEKDGNRLLKGEVTTFTVHEDNTYAGTVMLRVVLTNADGRKLWEGSAIGHSKKWGRSLNADNYNETFSDALVDAASDLLKNRGFLKAASAK